MGKSAVCIALILSNREKRLAARYKETLIVTNNTLVQQWANELTKFAPGMLKNNIYMPNYNDVEIIICYAYYVVLVIVHNFTIL